MKFRAERQELSEAVQWATRTVSSRVTLPALAGVYLEAADGRLTCRATDQETSAEVTIPVQVEQPGKALLLGKLLGQLVSKLPDAPVEFDGGVDRVAIRCGRASFEVRGMPVDDFPTLPEPGEDTPRGAIKAEAFGKLVHQVARAAAAEESRPVLMGVLLEAKDGQLTAAATDSYRLAVCTIPWDQAVEGKVLVPGRALQEAARAANEQGGAVTLVLEERQASFLYGDRRLTSSLIEGQFPNFNQLLPDGFETAAVIERAALAEALQRASIVAQRQANTPVRLKFEDGSVELTAQNTETGAANEAVPCELHGPGLEIAFNPGYLLEGLDAAGTDKVRIELRDGLKPAVLKPHVDADGDAELDDFSYLLMPMRVS